MHSAHDLLTRWPALDVAAKRAHLQNVLQVFIGPVHQAWIARTDAAGRLGWRDSTDPAEVFTSFRSSGIDPFGERLLTARRNQFEGHSVKKRDA